MKIKQILLLALLLLFVAAQASAGILGPDEGSYPGSPGSGAATSRIIINPISGALSATSAAGTGTLQPSEAHLGNAGGYGNNTNFPTGNIIVQTKATNAGHFTQLTCNNQSLNAGSCTTAPIVNVFDVTTGGVAPVSCVNTAQVTKGTTTTVAQTLPFAAGDVIGLFVSTQGATCLAPTFSVDATITYP